MCWRTWSKEADGSVVAHVRPKRRQRQRCGSCGRRSPLYATLPSDAELEGWLQCLADEVHRLPVRRVRTTTKDNCRSTWLQHQHNPMLVPERDSTSYSRPVEARVAGEHKRLQFRKEIVQRAR